MTNLAHNAVSWPSRAPRGWAYVAYRNDDHGALSAHNSLALAVAAAYDDAALMTDGAVFWHAGPSIHTPGSVAGGYLSDSNDPDADDFLWFVVAVRDNDDALEAANDAWLSLLDDYDLS